MPNRKPVQRLTSFAVSALLATKAFKWNQTGSTTATVPLFVAQRRMRIRSASWVAQNATDGAKTCQLKNNTKTVNPSAALTVNGVAALAAAPFVLSTTESDLILNTGDVLVAVYTVTTAGTVQPGEVSVSVEMQYR